MPTYARRTRPSLIRAPMMSRVVALIGTASPRPTPATAVLTPTIRGGGLSARAPPELPGFRAASVWMTSSTRPAAPAGLPPAGPGRAPTPPPPSPSRRSPERVADRDDELAHLEGVGVAERRAAGEVAPVGPQHRQVGQRVGPDDR